jgi:hypothetical protein
MRIEDMSYKQFKEYCNERVCDGQWSMKEAIACVGMINEVEVAVKGKLFKKKAREKHGKN